MLQYLLWRTLVGLHSKITLSFLIVGHTKFSPDWCFGLLKQRFRRTNVGCLDDIAAVVDSSARVNVPQLVGTQEGDINVQCYDWARMFAPHFSKLKNIKKYQHFSFDSSTPGIIQFRVKSDSEVERIDLLKSAAWSPPASDLPEPVTPGGLSLERQWYLHNNIAEYCPDNVRDKVCPKPLEPLVPRENAASSHMPIAAQHSPSQTPTCSVAGPPAKKARLCSKCKQPGHNSRSCAKMC